MPQFIRPSGIRKLGLATALLLAAGCACHRGPRGFVAAAPGAAWVRTELIFGLGQAGGATVAAADWDDFLAREVTPRFPDGLTVEDAAGQWRNATGEVTREPAKVLVLYHPPDAAVQGKLEAIRSAYKARFKQESVLRATSPARVSF